MAYHHHHHHLGNSRNCVALLQRVDHYSDPPSVRFFATKAKNRRKKNRPDPNLTYPVKPRFPGNMKHTLTPGMDQTRAERIKELRNIAKEKILQYEDLYRKKTKGEKLPDPPPDAAHVLLQYVDHPIPQELVNSKDAIVDYIMNVFLAAYPKGARLRKLQRDIAFRMDTKDMYLKNKKMEYEKILPIIGEMERSGMIKIRLGKQGRLIIYKPSESQLAVEVLNKKIDLVMTKHFANDSVAQDDGDDGEDEIDDEEVAVKRGNDRKKHAKVDSDDEEDDSDDEEVSVKHGRKKRVTNRKKHVKADSDDEEDAADDEEIDDEEVSVKRGNIRKKQAKADSDDEEDASDKEEIDDEVVSIKHNRKKRGNIRKKHAKADSDDDDSEEVEKLELTKRDYERRYGLEEDQVDWIEEDYRNRPK
jgi:hypothetical protein